MRQEATGFSPAPGTLLPALIQAGSSPITLNASRPFLLPALFFRLPALILVSALFRRDSAPSLSVLPALFFFPPFSSFSLCKGSRQGGTIKGKLLSSTLNRFLTLGTVVVGAD